MTRDRKKLDVGPDYFRDLAVEDQMEHIQDVGVLEGQLTSVFGDEALEMWRARFSKRNLYALRIATVELLRGAEKHCKVLERSVNTAEKFNGMFEQALGEVEREIRRGKVPSVVKDMQKQEMKIS